MCANKYIQAPIHGKTCFTNIYKHQYMAKHVLQQIWIFPSDCYWSPIGLLWYWGGSVKYCPITTICKHGKVVKKIPWTAFLLDELRWQWVVWCAEILEVWILNF